MQVLVRIYNSSLGKRDAGDIYQKKFLNLYKTYLVRLLMLIMLFIFCPWRSIAQHKTTKEEIVKWLQEKLASQTIVGNKNTPRLNYTKMCVNVNFLPDEATVNKVAISKNFKDRIVSHVSWKQDEMDVQNDIFIQGKLRETYTYQLPLTAIVSAKITNCIKNVSGNVDAYMDRPIFITVKKNTTKISHQAFNKDGKVNAGKAVHFYNSKDADWDSIIPIAGSWDSNADLQEKIVKALTRLAELNDQKYTLN